MLHEHYGIESIVQTCAYQKPYPEFYNSYLYPPGFRVSKIVKFIGENNMTTWKHVSQFLVQMGDASSVNYLKVRHFPLSLPGIVFSWFSALPPGSIFT
jgi:hypothetical protein